MNVFTRAEAQTSSWFLVSPWKLISISEWFNVHLPSVLRSRFSLQKAVCRKLVVCSGCMLFFFTVTRSLPITYNVEPDFVSQASFPTRLTYAFFSIQAARPKFYFAWTLGKGVCVFSGKCHGSHVIIFLCLPLAADAVNNAAGYGFRGFDEYGKPSWDLISNLNIIGIEVPCFRRLKSRALSFSAVSDCRLIGHWSTLLFYWFIYLFIFRPQPASRPS